MIKRACLCAICRRGDFIRVRKTADGYRISCDKCGRNIERLNLDWAIDEWNNANGVAIDYPVKDLQPEQELPAEQPDTKLLIIEALAKHLLTTIQDYESEQKE